MELKGKNVMVLGGAGFIGSALVRGLLYENANVAVYDNLSFGRKSNLEEIKNKIKIIKGDVLDYSHLLNAVKKHRIEYIFHLIADPFVPNSYNYPGKVFNLITQSTRNALNVCREVKIKKIIYFSSAEVYGNYKYLPIDENHPVNPLSIYAAAKLAADNMCYADFHENNTPVAIIRLFNAFGPRETHPYIIPELILQLSKSNIIKLGNLGSRRSFLYVDDAVEGAINLLKHKSKNIILNLGSDKSYSVEELANIIGKMFGHESIEIISEEKRKRRPDPKILECNYSQAKSLIGWKPKTTFEEGLNKTVKWFLENDRKWIWEETYNKLY